MLVIGKQIIKVVLFYNTMENTVADFYAGFEGEPEVILLRQGKENYVLKAWDGYFSHVLDAIEPGEDGQWQGLPLHYHLMTGWYESENFEVQHPTLFASQLNHLDPSVFDAQTLRFYHSLRKFVEDTVEAHEPLFIKYF